MNFQNVPRKEKLIKGAFKPKLDYLLFADYSQIEYRLLAYYLAAVLDDHTMAENFKAGIDPHSATARLMLGLPRDAELTDAQRQVGKTGNFSIMYAGGVPTIMRQLGCDEDRARELLRALRDSMPGIKALNDSIRDTYRERGYIMSIAGRHLSVDPAVAEKRGQHRAEAALLNYLIQGSAAELMRDALIKVHNYLHDAHMESHMVNVVHDEIQMDGSWEELNRLVEQVPILMGNEQVEQYLPIEVDIEISETSWADKHPLED